MVVRTTVFKLVASSGTGTRFGDPDLLSEAARLTGRPRPEVWEALWALTADGLIYLDASGRSKDNWHWRISSIGAKTASGGPWEPWDPEGYLARLHRGIPDLDPVAVQYFEEAPRSFNARCYLASSVMHGVASEQVSPSRRRALRTPSAAAPRTYGRRSTIPTRRRYKRFLEMRRRLEPLRTQLPDDLGDTRTLDAVADLLRMTRNDAGHPTGQAVDEDTAYTHLQMAARLPGAARPCRHRGQRNLHRHALTAVDEGPGTRRCRVPPS
jgi:hypothetical protein